APIPKTERPRELKLSQDVVVAARYNNNYYKLQTGHWLIGVHAGRLGLPFNHYCRSCKGRERRERFSISSVNARHWLLGGGLFWADTCSLTWVNCLSQG
ncbi:hypothetical protein EVAR_73717_1, partial [Eumeta japonica]